ncbi:Kinesin heavy chain [Bifiguratus adelaidae]|uniref:Kinesin heavy chain n=1 Tax=Bifiguratus adelaidae TaxID=1938954 RepID=A0A261XZB9_9FUNG|nr:Kinesin heavy chain [Bifiguratus adelaidae]
MSGNNIKVVCRFRPQNSLEIKEGGVPIIQVDEDGTSVDLKGQDFQGAFAFDKVFGTNTRQQDVFEYSIKSIVDDVVSGYNGTVFAYGQTGSDIDNDETKGIIPRIVEQIFQSILNSPANMEFTVKVSYMEIYMEKVRDLLNPSNDNLPIHEDKARGVYVKGLLEVYVSSVGEVYEVMRRGGTARAVAFTNMNAESSRSHSIFLINITQKNIDTGAAKSGNLFLVDLAGSEKVGKTGASGQTLEEAKKINKSLTALGMVINNLTDGKSTHIPYRDSKLTRILQESLGGNSRTTLIINCSPSSYNEAETLSTLRFGVRAKTIRNKAKVNADLSPAELKALLKKVKAEAVTYQQYINALESEVGVWRSGGKVPEAQWALMDKAAKGDAPPATPAPGFKSPVPFDISRPSTPAVTLDRDEREEFLKRENELMDSIAEKETELQNREKLLDTMKEEITYFKEQETQITKENQTMTSELNDLRLQLQKISYESKENAITVDSMKEANQELTHELEDLKRALLELKSSRKDSVDDVKEKKKAEKMKEMLANFTDSSGEVSSKERQIRDALHRLEYGTPVDLPPEDLHTIRRELAESRRALEQQEQTIRNLQYEKDVLETKRADLEERFASLEAEYEELLDKTIQEEEANIEKNTDFAETVADLKIKLENQFNARREMQQRDLEDLRKELARKNDEYQKLNATMMELKVANEELQYSLANQPRSAGELGDKEKDLERMRKSMAQQLSDFETMKKALMRDLQGRCERVVELEISLDETREQYNNVLRASNSKAQQKKMAFLERNLEQLTNVQRQLVEQNSSLKKETAIAERKLIARNERIQSLETLLQDAQEKLISQNQKFEAQLQAVRERLEQARTQKAQNAMAALNFGRIAKPLRGGAAVEDNSDNKDGKKSSKEYVEDIAELEKLKQTATRSNVIAYLEANLQQTQALKQKAMRREEEAERERMEEAKREEERKARAEKLQAQGVKLPEPISTSEAKIQTIYITTNYGWRDIYINIKKADEIQPDQFKLDVTERNLNLDITNHYGVHYNFKITNLEGAVIPDKTRTKASFKADQVVLILKKKEQGKEWKELRHRSIREYYHDLMRAEENGTLGPPPGAEPDAMQTMMQNMYEQSGDETKRMMAKAYEEARKGGMGGMGGLGGLMGMGMPGFGMDGCGHDHGHSH